MTENLSDDEQLAQDWLRQRGYETNYYPTLVASGRRPDFLAIGSVPNTTPGLFWAEVKSLDPDSTAAAIHKVLPIVRAFNMPCDIKGHATLHVTPGTREQSVRALLKLFCSKINGRGLEDSHLIFVQHDPDKRDIRHVEVQGLIVEKVWARGAGDGMIAAPIGTIEDPFAAAIWEQNGIQSTGKVFKIFNKSLQFNCALVVNIDSNELPLSISVAASGSSNVAVRTMSALEQANSQLRNACTFKAAPGIVFIIPAEHYVDDRAIAMGAYGKLTALMDRNTGKITETFFGDDGAFRPSKNTHISAAIRLRQNGEPGTYFPNPYAKEPVVETAYLFSGLIRGPVQFRKYEPE
jgi:hypothetical protein